MKLQNATSYEVVSFLYATSGIAALDSLFFRHPPNSAKSPWDRMYNWMGYVAVSNHLASRSQGHRVIYVVWRGTLTESEWSSNILGFEPVAIDPLLTPRTDRSLFDWFRDKNPKVHMGWLDIYTSVSNISGFRNKSARGQLWDVIDSLKQKYEGEKLSIVVIGHSLGGALATLSAFDLAVNGSRDIPVAVFGFSCPKVGNEAFNDTVKRYNNFKILHVHTQGDLVPNVPGPRYTPIRTAELEVQARLSPHLKYTVTPVSLHNLEVLLHVVAGWNGPNAPFDLKVKRSLALVNKGTGLLLDKYRIPQFWWDNRDKLGMVYNEKTEEWELKGK